ncbi:hypothetical protein PG996_001140 [Apiospora saccharicola]|uniref:Uncharacterized protein n=1 Tax=Apiospora saccharicola TaxID=335842 RepID=A0ABR1WFR7_9PEZI
MAREDVLYQTMSNGFRTDLWNPSRRCDQNALPIGVHYVSRLTDSSIVYDDPYMNGGGYHRSRDNPPSLLGLQEVTVHLEVSLILPEQALRMAYLQLSVQLAQSDASSLHIHPHQPTTRGRYPRPIRNLRILWRPKPPGWEAGGSYSPHDSLDDLVVSPNGLDGDMGSATAGSSSRNNAKGRPQRRPSNRDEFDGPHQFLKRPHPEYIASQERELPHLPTHLLVQEQDHILTQVNDRLSQCAFDFVAKYQFPIPLTQDVRPVERPSDREWTEWVYLLKRLATKRRIPARVLYNGQIKQFVTILENSLEMRHAAKHQSRPLKDDRNILQLISAGIQVAKILKDAAAMDFLDHLYVSTQRQIDERSAAAHARFR